MCGPPGVGKTLAACYALALHSGRYVTSYGLARPEVEVDVLARPKLLVIDQLGREYSGRSDYALSRLEELLDERYAQLRKTILVGNLLEKQFRDRYDIIIGDRFRGDGQYVAVSGESLRGRAEGGDCAEAANGD